MIRKLPESTVRFVEAVQDLLDPEDPDTERSLDNSTAAADELQDANAALQDRIQEHLEADYRRGVHFDGYRREVINGKPRWHPLAEEAAGRRTCEQNSRIHPSLRPIGEPHE